MMDYKGQNKEDQFIIQYFDGLRDANLLDIGAFDGKTFSNSFNLLTYFGWHGVLVEAEPKTAHDCYENTKDTNALTLCAAVTINLDGIIDFHTSNGQMVGSSDMNHVKKWSKDVTFNRINVAGVSINTIIQTYGTEFAFINIDVEGQSADLAVEIIPLFKDCRCICIEHDNRYDELRDLAWANGYTKELLFNAENIIFGK
jgi:FkbM family methyltransferase